MEQVLARNRARDLAEKEAAMAGNREQEAAQRGEQGAKPQMEATVRNQLADKEGSRVWEADQRGEPGVKPKMAAMVRNQLADREGSRAQGQRGEPGVKPNKTAMDRKLLNHEVKHRVGLCRVQSAVEAAARDLVVDMVLLAMGGQGLAALFQQILGTAGHSPSSAVALA
jgi:hypothetical protein